VAIRPPPALNSSAADKRAFTPALTAATQNNLGIAYGDIPGGDRAANIQQAIECYEAALRVQTEQAFPREHKIVQDGLESARKLLK